MKAKFKFILGNIITHYSDKSLVLTCDITFGASTTGTRKKVLKVCGTWTREPGMSGTLEIYIEGTRFW